MNERKAFLVVMFGRGRLFNRHELDFYKKSWQSINGKRNYKAIHTSGRIDSKQVKKE